MVTAMHVGRAALRTRLTSRTWSAQAAELLSVTTTRPHRTSTGSAPHLSFLKVLTSSDCRGQRRGVTDLRATGLDRRDGKGKAASQTYTIWF